MCCCEYFHDVDLQSPRGRILIMTFSKNISHHNILVANISQIYTNKSSIEFVLIDVMLSKNLRTIPNAG